MAALAGQVLAVGEEAGGPSALERQPGVDEGGGAAVMVHEERLHSYAQKKKQGSVNNSLLNNIQIFFFIYSNPLS